MLTSDPRRHDRTAMACPKLSTLRLRFCTRTVTTTYVPLSEAPGSFRVCRNLHRLGMLGVSYLPVQNPTPLLYNLPRIL